MVLTLWMVRARHSQPEGGVNKVYEGIDNYFTLKIHHGGIFTRTPRRRYIDGVVDYVDFVDIDLFSIHELDAMVQELGYVNDITLFYHFLIPDVDLDNGLLPLGNDGDVHRLAQYVTANKEIKVYIEIGFSRVNNHFVSPTKVVIQELEEVISPELDRNIKKKKDVPSSSRKLDFSKQIVPYGSRIEIDTDDTDCGNGEAPIVEAVISDGVGEDGNDAAVIDDDAMSERVGSDGNDEAPTDEVEFNEDGNVGTDEDVGEDGNGKDGNSKASTDEDEFSEDGYVGTDEDVGEDGNGKDGNGKASTAEDEFSEDGYVGNETNTRFDDETVIDEVEVNMSNFTSAVDEDGDMLQEAQTEKEGEVHEHCADEQVEVLDNEVFESAAEEQDPRKRMLKSILKQVPCSSGEVHKKTFMVGQTFKTKKDARALIGDYSVVERRDLHYVKNDKIRLRVKCRGVVPQLTGVSNKGKGKLVHSKEKTCPWILLVSRANPVEDWTVTTYNDEHTCLPTRKVRACSYQFLANKIVQQVEGNPKIPAKALQDELEKKYCLEISKMKVFRAKALAKQYVYGDYEKQYGLLRDYALELQSKNPGTTVKIEVQSEPIASTPTRIFKRIYICLGALKQGFKAGLRDFIGLDGTFLKGPFPGQILSAVGLDSNNGIYPVAYAFVESENLSAWTWFLELLGDDLDLSTSSNFTFITDRQKGLLPAIAKVFPSAEHRFCLRHVYENMKGKCDELKQAVWKCGRATNIPTFNRAMEELKKLDPKAHEWLSNIPAKHWSVSHFSGRALSDTLLNNLCEVFNSKIDEARDKPIITCLEFIRVYLMERIVIVQKKIEKSKGCLTPTATDILEENKNKASQLRCVFNGSEKYQVTGQWMDQYVVNLRERTCTCKYWDVTGIPCKHAIAAMYDKMSNGSDCGEPENWVNKCYWLSTWMNMYQYKIDPINGKSMWPISTCPTTLLPPKHHKQVGRPKKKRKRAADEPSQTKKLTRKYLTVTCSKCHNKGHNARTCKGQGGPSEVGKKTRKKKGKAPAASEVEKKTRKKKGKAPAA